MTLSRKLRKKMIYDEFIGETKKRLRLGSSKDIPLLFRIFSPDLYLMKRVRKVEYLVKAANIVVNQLGYTDVLFLLKGRVPEKEYLKVIYKLIEKYKLEENVKIMLEYLPNEELKRLYIASDIYVLPSLEEPCPTSLLEPLACEKPLVGTDVGGIGTMIKNGWNGFLVEPANENQLAEKIKYLIDHPEKREEMGKNSRKLAEEEFDWKKIVEKYLEVYEEVKG